MDSVFFLLSIEQPLYKLYRAQVWSVLLCVLVYEWVRLDFLACITTVLW